MKFDIVRGSQFCLKTCVLDVHAPGHMAFFCPTEWLSDDQGKWFRDTFGGVGRCFACEMQELGPYLLFLTDFLARLRGMVIASWS